MMSQTVLTRINYPRNLDLSGAAAPILYDKNDS